MHHCNNKWRKKVTTKTAQDLIMKFGMKVEITKCHHFAKSEQNRAKAWVQNAKKGNFGRNAKSWLKSKTTLVEHYLKKFRNSQVTFK